MFENVKAKKNPIGLEFIKKGLLTTEQVNKVLEYQKDHKHLKFGEIVDVLDMCDKEELLKVIADKLQSPYILLSGNINIKPIEYLPRDVIINNKAFPFKIEGSKVHVAFSDIQNAEKVKKIQLMLMNSGYEMVPYITLYTDIMKEIGDVKSVENKFVDKEEKDTTKLIDNIIMTGISKRASDIHIEPMEDKIRVRFRIDGELINATELPKERQEIITGRIKAMANMYQEIAYDQDGSIDTFENFSIRVSSQKNIHGEKFVLRFLKKNTDVRNLYDLGFKNDQELVKRVFEKKNSLILVCAPTGEGKTTTLYSVLDYLNDPSINVVSIENPVELRIPGVNQIETGPNITFATALRTVLRQDPNIILVGEIRDKETAEIAVQAGQTGHLVLSTIHTIDAIEAITRMKKMGISPYDISSTLVTTVSQRLVRKLCDKCKVKHEMTEQERETIEKIGENNNVKFDLKDANMYEPYGCSKCNGTGYYERVALFEVLCLDDNLKDLILSGASNMDIRKYAIENIEYKPLVVDGIEKVLQGITTISEMEKRLTMD